MVLTALFFYMFAIVAVAAGFMVIVARNPVHSVLFLILAFFNSAGRFVLLGAEFLAMILLIVYVGAVAVLFLFVVMMLDVDFAELKAGFIRYMPVGAAVGALLLVELLLVLVAWHIDPQIAATATAPIPPASEVSNTEAIGRILYTKYVYFFQAAGVILLVAMIGAIVLTLQHKPNVKRQNVAEQIARDPKTAVRVTRVESGKGI